MGRSGAVVDPLTGLRIDDDEDEDDAAKGRRATKTEKHRRRKGRPNDAADADGGRAGKPDASEPKPRGRHERGGVSSDDDARGGGDAEEEGARMGGKGKARDKHHKKASHAPRPGQIGFEGLDDGGRSQSLYKGMSRGAVKKALERDAAEAARAAVPPPLEAPEVTTPVFDACAHLARVTETARESTLFRAWAAGDSAALACAPVGAVVNVTCDVEALDPAYGAPAYRAWERLFGDDEGDAGTTAGAFREPRVSDDVDAARAPVDPDFPEETSTTPRGDGAAHTADDREFQIHANFAPRRDNVYHAFGVHPSRAAEVDAAASAARVARFARETRAVAVGVCGCDFRRADEDARRAQLEVLAGCMAVARGEVESSAAGAEDDVTNGRNARGKEPRSANDRDDRDDRDDGRRATPATPLAVLLVSLGGADADDALFAAFLTHRDACVAAGASAVPAVFLDPSPRLAAAALARTPDALVSVSGAVTHAKNVALLEVAFDVPLDRIALASEAPGKIPTRLVGRLGRLGKSALRNSKGTKTREWSHPASLAFAAEKVAEVKGRGVTAEDVVAAAARNARRAFLGRRE